MYFYIKEDKLGLNNILPKSWQQIGKKILLSYSISVIKTIYPEQLDTNPKRIICGNSLWVFVKLKIEYPNSGVEKFHQTESYQSSLKMNIIEEDFYLVSFVKSEQIGYKGNKQQHVAESNSILASLELGLNIVSKIIASESIVFEKFETNYSVNVNHEFLMTTQKHWGANLEHSDIMKLCAIKNKHLAKSESAQTRINRASNWILKSQNFLSVDSFIAKWIAIETLCMENDSNIRPLVEIISKGYDLPYDATKQKFSLGKLKGLRSKIVHEGLNAKTEFHLNNVMDFLFLDALEVILETKCKKRAERYLESVKFELDEYISKLFSSNTT